MPSRAWLRLAPFLLVALIGAAYAPSLRGDFVVWDDDDHIYENRYIVAQDGYREAWRNWQDPIFYPITFTIWYAEWRLADGKPWLFHLDNIALHAADALLLGLLLQALGLRYGLAWAIAGVWALHPQQVESVAWLTERKNLLYVAFYLASALVYARSVGPVQPGSNRAWLLALLLALGALLSKATAVTLPITLALTHWVRGARFDRRASVRIGAFFALSIAVGLLHTTREQVFSPLDLGTRLLIAARATWFYVGKFLWPTGLVAVYPRWPTDELTTTGGFALAGLTVVAALAAWKARAIPRIAWWSAAVYVTNLALVAGVIWFGFMGYSYVADHFVYLAAVGLAAMLGLAADAALGRLRAGTPARAALTLTLWLLLATATWKQTGMWLDTEALWTQTLAANPDSRLARKNLGAYLMEEGRDEEARKQFEKTLALDPDDVEALQNLGVLASNRGDWPEALRYYQQTLERGAYPALTLNNLGIVAARMGDPRAAIAYYEKSLEIDPGEAKTWMNLGAARADVGDLDGAIEDYQESLARNPRSAEVHFNLAVALHRAGHAEEASQHYVEAHELAPDDPDPLYNLGVVSMESDRLEAAAASFREVIALDPTYADAHHNLGAIALAQGDLEAAERDFARAHDLAPDDVATAGQLAALRYRARDVAGAIDVLERVLALAPEAAPIANRLAWIRATCPWADWRDPQAALALAERATKQDPEEVAYLDTLAAAQAAVGRFGDAAATEGLALARTPPDHPLAAERARRRDLYAAGRPFAFGAP